MIGIVFGSLTAVLGLLIAWGPKFLFYVCTSSCCCANPPCFYAAQAEIAMGMVIAALGLCVILYNDPKTRFGLAISIFLTGLIALLIPLVIFGGCVVLDMACHRIGFPALIILSSLLLACCVFYILRLCLKDSVCKLNS